MATALTSSPNRAEPPDAQRFVLRGVDWKTYRQISDALTGRHVRLTFDGSNLEFMTISSVHANCCRLFVRLIVTLTEEFKQTVRSFGDMTCDREDAKKGLEPDECFYIDNEPAVRGKEKIDLDVDPPPDLAVEVDISPSPRNRMAVYASIEVPEVWRYDGSNLVVYRLQEKDQYQEVESSRYFPNISLATIAGFVNRRNDIDENTLVREFRTWVREQIAAKD